MNNRHIVDTAVFDIGFSSEATAFELQSELNGFIHKQLLAVVEEVFDKNAAANAVIRIPSLEIDLGDVAVSRYKDELPRRLRHKLTDLLAEIQQSIRDNSASNNAVIDAAAANSELLQFFLIHGHLPWHSGLADGKSFEQLLSEMIVSEPQRLKHFLRNTTHKDTVIDRLVSQFGADSVRQVFRLLAPAQASQINELVDVLLFEFDLSAVDAMEQQLWSRLIMLVLEKGSRQLNSEELVRHVLQGLLVQLPNIRKILLPLNAQMTETDMPGSSSLGLILKQLLAAEVSDDADNDQIEADKFEQRLVDLLCSGNISTIKDSWSVLIDEHSGLLKQLLRQYGMRADVRQRIAQGFSAAMLDDILNIIEPVEHGFVKAVIAQPELFLPQGSGQAQTGRRLNEQMWDFTLGYLLVERGSHFNKKSYLASLLRQMAMSTGDSYQALLTSLTQMLAASAVANGLNQQLLSILDELSQESSSPAESQNPDVNSDQRSYELYELLSRVLRNGTDKKSSVEHALLEAVHELKNTAPWLLLRLLKEIQLGEYGQPLRADNLPAPLLRQLAMTIINLAKPADSSGTTDLINAIDSHAARITNVTRYFSHIIFCLLNGQLLDFDAIMAQSSSHVSVALDKPEHDKGGSLKQETDLHGSEHIVAHFFEGKYDSAWKANVLAFDKVATESPALLRQLLAEKMDRQAIIKLSRLPEKMLSQFLTLMGVANRHSLQQCSEVITTACYIKELAVQPQQLREFKWQSVFSYIADRGGVYSEQDFVQYFITSLCDFCRQSESAQVINAVCTQVAVNAQPTTKDLSKRIIGWLDGTGSGQTSESQPHPAVSIDPVADDQEQPLEDIYIANAGLVLAAPYLPRLFDMLGLLQQSAFTDRQAAVRGVHMLQFLVDGSSFTPEYQLVLNKLLCGVKTGIPIEREVSLSEAETYQLEGLLQGMIQNWKSLGKTSVVGLRESFLQRQGHLQLRDDAWHLRVESKSFDMLLDQIPWSYSTIKYPWMDKVIYVEWR